MDFLELAMSRYSVRQFRATPVEPEKLGMILEAGRVAPTAANLQPQRILVLDSLDALGKLRSCTSSHFFAPLALLVCYDTNVSWKRSYDKRDMGEVDAAIVATHMMLEAAALGLGSTWVAHFDPEKVRSAFRLPDEYEPVALLPMGYPAEDSAPHANHGRRKEITDTVFRQEFGRE
jgi:nitroreductase